MPYAPAKPCRYAGCGVLVRDGSGYCEKHAEHRYKGKWADSRRGSRQSRGYDAEWERARLETLVEDQGLCRPCRQQGKLTPATQVDHIVPVAEAKAMGWTKAQINAPTNRQSICTVCHKCKTQAEAQRARRGGGG